MQASQRPPTILGLAKDEYAARLGVRWLRGGAWYGPPWALLCGLVAAARFRWSLDQSLLLLVALLVAGGLWPALWIALAETGWAAPLSRWRDWHEGAPLRPLPYAQPNSPAARMVVTLGHLCDWVSRDLLPEHGGALLVSAAAPVVALVLSAILGETAMLLTVVAILLPQLALRLCRADGHPSSLLRGLVGVSLPMLLGYSLFTPVTPEMAAAAAGFGLAFAGSGDGEWDTRAWNLGQAVVLALLVATRHSTGAFLVALLWLPQFLLQARWSAGIAPLRRARWWLLAAMLVTAIAL